MNRRLSPKTWNTRIRTVAFVLATLAVTTTAPPARAVTRNWLTATTDFFDVASRWTGSSVPGALDTAEFNVAGTYSIQFDNLSGDRTNAALEVFAGNVTFARQSGAARTYTAATGNISGGRYQITDMTFAPTNLLSINNGGRVDVNGGGQILGGAGSLITLGSTGSASQNLMVVFAGATASSNLGYVGETSGKVGRAVVNGAGAQWNLTSDLFVGRTASSMSVIDSSSNGNVTLLANSVMFLDNATVGPLTQQAGGDLNFSLRGLSDFDNLAVQGAASLLGDLFVTLDNFVPQQGNSFQLLTTTGGVTTNFSSQNFPTLSGGLTWQLQNSGSALTLRVVGGINGDFNNDGLYNCGDINQLADVIASGANVSSFDLTADGLVNLADQNAWLSEAGGVNIGAGRAYKLGDANLEGVVDGSDFGIWNGSEFTANTAWCSGNFNGDTGVDGSDFGLLQIPP